jgi:signal transduction histidine kinase
MTRFGKGEGVRFVVAMIDLSAVRAMERQLQEAAEQWRSLAQHTAGVILEVDRHGKIVFASHPTLNGDLHLAKALSIYDAFPETAHGKLRESIQRVFYEGSLATCEMKGFGDYWYGLRFGPVHRFQQSNEAFNVSTVIVTDVTAEKGRNSQMKAARDQLRGLSAKMDKVREEERTRIARELHDEFGQALTALKMELSWIEGHLLSSDGTRERVQRLIEATDGLIGNLRHMVSDLRPPMLDDLGLVAAIEWQLQDFEKRSGIRCRMKADKRQLDLSEDRATALFRAVQEALTNVARHAQAKNVSVGMKMDRGRLVVSIRDDGVGITLDKIADPASLGLLGMRERMERLGGQVRIQGSPQAGTRIRLQIPLD